MQNPLIPMVAMTGAPQKDEVFAFVKTMKEKCGFTQLMLYPRTGCEVEYLSEEWFAALFVLLRERGGKRYENLAVR